MNDRAENSLQSPVGLQELWTLERRWYEGQLLAHVEGLLHFAERHRGWILAQVGDGEVDAEHCVDVLKRLIQQTGAVDPSTELRDQAKEIRDEIWYRGEKGEFDRTKIQLEWTEHHAAAWRKWRIKEYLFVAERLGPQLMRVLQPGATGTGN